MTSVTGDKHSAVIEAGEYFESVVSEFLSASSKQNDSVADRIKLCMKEINNKYMNRLHTTERTDWSDECNRCAYVYRFFAIHSYMVYQSLQLALADKEHLTEIWKYKSSFRVCCIGGGPGSDAVGLTKFLRDTQLVPTNRLECSIFDLRKEWEDTWQKITRNNASDEFPPMTYFSGSMTRTESGLTLDEMDKVRAADVISFVKFFSTVATVMRNDSTRGDILRAIFRELKPGALVLYIDNRHGYKDIEFKKIAAFGGVKEMLYKNDMDFRMPEAKRSVILSCFDRITGKNPHNFFKVSVMLLRKPPINNGQNLLPRTPEPIATPIGQPTDVADNARPEPRYPVRTNRGKPPNRFVPY